jgi:hypothetical protein
MSSIPAALVEPLRRIAALAYHGESGESHVENPDVQLFELRRFFTPEVMQALPDFMAKEVEELSGGTKSVRECPEVQHKIMGRAVGLAVVPANAPEGSVLMKDAELAFIVGPADPGYLTFRH